MTYRINNIIGNIKNKSLSEVFEEFIEYKEAEGISERTKKDYLKHITKLLEVTDNNLNEDNIKRGIIKTFNTVSNMSAVTYNMKYKYLNCFFNYCQKEKYIKENPLKQLGLKKKKEVARIIDIEPSIIDALLKLMDLRTYVGLRDYVIMIMFLDTGIRPNELLHLERRDIKFRSQEIKVREKIAKTREERILPISNICVTYLRKLLIVTPEEWGDFIFYTCEGNRLTSERLNKIFQRYSKVLEYNISPYSLRHEFAILYLRNNGNIFSLQKLLGHSNLEMVKRYLAISQVDLKQQHLIASPLNLFVKRNIRIRKI